MNRESALPLLTLTAALLLSALFCAPTARAAEADQPASVEEPEQPAVESEAGTSEGAESSEVFIPTEEISEDFAVSFPVDI